VNSTFPKYSLPTSINERAKDILVLGLAKHEIILNVSNFPTEGGQSNVDIHHISHTAGGSGMNVAVAASRLGSQSALITSIGTGIYAQTVRNELLQSGVDTTFVKQIEGTEGSILIVLTQPDGDWTVMQSNAKSLKITSQQIPDRLVLSQYKIMHIDAYVYTNKDQRKIVESAITQARKANCIISIDTSVPITRDEPEYVLELFSKCDIIFLNDDESRNLNKIDTHQKPIETLQNLSADLVILKQGESGSTIISNHNYGNTPAFQVETKDTIGAGDNYAGAMLQKLCNRYSLYEASLWGSAAGSLACLGYGSLSYRYTEQDIQQLISTSKNTNGTT
tara:strand:+ start:309 stop:1316 length:1008 start_codon:yes stop_codon:yes gene_type:complete